MPKHEWVSTADRTRKPLSNRSLRKIFRDVASGAVDSRKGLAEAIGYERDGDMLVVWKLDRLGRSLKSPVPGFGEQPNTKPG